MFSQVLLLVIAIVLMAFLANVLLNAIEKISKSFGLSFFATGALFFGFGLSLPNLVFSQAAVRQDEFAAAIGLVIGVMASNLFFIYGMSGFFGRLLILRQEILIQFFFQLVSMLILGPIFFLGYYQVVCGVILIGFFIFYLWKMPICDRKTEIKSMPVPLWIWCQALIALVLLFGVEGFLVSASQDLGRVWEVPSFVSSAILLGITLTLPQLLVALNAILTKKNTDLITGSVVGANMFNGCFLLGIACFYNFNFKKDFLTEWVVLVLGALCLVLLVKIKRNFYRISSAVFLTFYFFLIFYWAAYG